MTEYSTMLPAKKKSSFEQELEMIKNQLKNEKES